MHENTRSKNKIPQRFSLHLCEKVSKIIFITLSSVIFLWLSRAYLNIAILGSKLELARNRK